MSMDMFEKQADELQAQEAPLATRMRPNSLNTFVGQEHIIGPGRVLRKAVESGKIPSIILWGPPGSGKTTLAYIIANMTGASFSPISAVSASVNDLRRIIEEAKGRRQVNLQRTILFIDEIHRFNKTQQDAVLPFVEDGTITLIGATTENPSFEVTSPLLSRSRVMPLRPLTDEQIQVILTRALKDTLRGLGYLNVEVAPEALGHLTTLSNHDARIALNALEMAALSTPPDEEGKRYITLPTVEDALQRRVLPHDKSGDQHYDFISALHKSMRGSDPDASLYWLARMLEAGEDPLYIARRLVRFASEDVGMADPQALVIAMAAQQAVHFIGMPEGNLALAEAVVYLATAPKSNSLYEAYSRAQQEITQGPSESVPLHLRNPVTPLMQEMGYGKDYKYAHDYPNHFAEQQNLPDRLQGAKYYTPSTQGYEAQIITRLKSWWQKKTQPERAETEPDEPDLSETEPEDNSSEES
ncbi:MAG: replication-associated recombination protein A [Dehalococcoidales bacterium]